MEIVSKVDGLVLSMFDCFVGEEALLGLFFLWYLPTENKKLLRNHNAQFATEIPRKYLSHLFTKLLRITSKQIMTEAILFLFVCLTMFFISPKKAITTTTINKINETKGLRQMPLDLFTCYGPGDPELFLVNITIEVP